MELVALVALRRKEPDLPRPYAIPGGIAGVISVALLPIATIGIALVASVKEDWRGQIPVLVLLLTGPIYYAIARSIQAPAR